MGVCVPTPGGVLVHWRVCSVSVLSQFVTYCAGCCVWVVSQSREKEFVPPGLWDILDICCQQFV